MKKLKFKVPSEVILLPGDKDTNFVYQVKPSLKEKYVADVNTLETLQDRVFLISQLKSHLVCQTIGDGTSSSKCFLNNLVLLDGAMPSLVAKVLSEALLLKTRRLCEVVDLLDLILVDKFVPSFIKIKIKRLLYHLAIGMTKEEAWNCNYLADKTKFPAVPEPCIHTEEFLDFVYQKTFLEYINEEAFDYGRIELHGEGQQWIKLNLQLKFKK